MIVPNFTEQVNTKARQNTRKEFSILKNRLELTDTEFFATTTRLCNQMIL